MKKLKKIKLYDLSKAEMASKELGLLRGGSGVRCACVTVCLESVCSCMQSSSGAFSVTWDDYHSHTNLNEWAFSEGDLLKDDVTKPDPY